MKGIIAVALAAVISLSGCARDFTKDGKTFSSYGLLNPDQRNPKLAYRTIWGNVFWGGVLVETVIVPIYFFGFSIFEPVGLAGDYEPGQTK